MDKFEGLNISSKFAICGLPIRLDSYKTCDMGCKYCFANARKIMEFKKELQLANVDSIKRRLEKLKSVDEPTSFLDKMIKSGVTWHCGGMSDPFQQAEGEYHITEQIVDVTKEHGITILFSTKSDTVYGANVTPNLHTFQLSVSNIDNRRDIECNVPDIQSRYNFFRDLKKEGFKVGIRLQPFIPNVTNLDIIKMFQGADHFTLEGLKVVPQNAEQKDFVFNELGISKDLFIQKGLLTLKPEYRLELYKPFIEYFKEHNISYSISDNDLRKYSNNACCCGDALVSGATSFNTTAMIQRYGDSYELSDIHTELDKYKCSDCVVYSLFTSNRTQGCKTVKDFFDKRISEKTSPFSPKFQYNESESNKPSWKKLQLSLF